MTIWQPVLHILFYIMRTNQLFSPICDHIIQVLSILFRYMSSLVRHSPKAHRIQVSRLTLRVGFAGSVQRSDTDVPRNASAAIAENRTANPVDNSLHQQLQTFQRVAFQA